MDYNISSEKLEHPLLKNYWRYYSCISKIGNQVFRHRSNCKDIIMELHGERSGRRTQDIDIAIAVDKWEEFKTIEYEITTA
jgi:hypothetical protein